MFYNIKNNYLNTCFNRKEFTKFAAPNCLYIFVYLFTFTYEFNCFLAPCYGCIQSYILYSQIIR